MHFFFSFRLFPFQNKKRN